METESEGGRERDTRSVGFRLGIPGAIIEPERVGLLGDSVMVTVPAVLRMSPVLDI